MKDEDWKVLIDYVGLNLRDFRDFIADEKHDDPYAPSARARAILDTLHELRKRGTLNGNEKQSE